MENTNTKEVKEQSKAVKIIKIVVNVIFYTLIAALFLFSIANLNKKDEYAVPSLFGRGFTTVATNSMAGDQKDSFTDKDLVFLKVVTDKNRDKLADKLEEGDIITFKSWNAQLGQYMLNTHRIVHVNEDGTFTTKGDANAVEDSDRVARADLRGIYTGKWKGVGSAFKFLQTSTGFLVCIVLPVLIFFIVELVLFILQLTKYRKLKTDEKHSAEMEQLQLENEKKLEEERARIRAEILAEQAAKEEAAQAENKTETEEENKEE